MVTKDLQKPKPTMVMLGSTEEQIIERFAKAIGTTSNSAALRQIVREWNRLKALEQSGALRGDKEQAS